jgi:phosphatidate cytidylyltransferase
MIGCILILGISFSLLIIIRNINLTWIIYLFIIAVFTDTYAFISGKLIGKHKCTPKISPNKTWEGAILGTVMGVYTATVYIIFHYSHDTIFIYNRPIWRFNFFSNKKKL